MKPLLKVELNFTQLRGTFLDSSRKCHELKIIRVGDFKIATITATSCTGSNEDASDSEIERHLASASWANVRSSCEVGYSMICSGQRELLRYEQ